MDSSSRIDENRKVNVCACPVCPCPKGLRNDDTRRPSLEANFRYIPEKRVSWAQLWNLLILIYYKKSNERRIMKICTHFNQVYLKLLKWKHYSKIFILIYFFMHKGQTLGNFFYFQTFLHPIIFLRPNE